MTFTGDSPSIEEAYRLFQQANPVSLEDLPDSRSPVAEALYARLVEAGAEGSDASVRGSRLSRRALAAAAAAGAVALAVALVPARLADRGDVAGVDVVERALAAVSGGPVLHAIVENEDNDVSLVDLASGEETPQANRIEYWYDADRESLRLRMSIGAQVLREFVQSPAGVFTDRGRFLVPAGPPRLPPALDGFATRYRLALASGTARVLGRATVGGRDAVRLEVTMPALGSGPERRPREVAEVLVDAETYRPLRFRHQPSPDTPPPPWWRVIAIEGIARTPRDFAPPKVTGRQFESETLSNPQALTLTEAAMALGRPAVWAGPAVEGLAFTGADRTVVTTTWSAGGVTESSSLVITYESNDEAESRSWLQILVRDSSDPSSAVPRFGPLDGQPVPAGRLLLAKLEPPPSAPAGEPTMWFGTLEHDGLRVNVQSPRRELVIAAAKNLTPLRQ